MSSDAKDKPAPRWNIAPYFMVADLVAAANFYRDKLGFHYQRFWGDPPCFTIVFRSGVSIMLKSEANCQAKPNRMSDPEDFAWDAYVWVDNADALYAEFKSKGVKVVREICDQEYGCRDFDIEDCNGYRLCFGQDLSS